MNRFSFALGAGVLAALAAFHLEKPAFGLTIIHSNDVLGDIEPCGCRSNPQGGMIRKFNFLRLFNDPELLQLDAGDLLFSADSIPELLREQSEAQASYLLKAMDLLHHDAVVPGEKEFALGVDVFEKLRKQTKVQFLAANLTKANGDSFLEPYAIFKKKGADGKPVRIAVVGIVGEQLKWPPTLKASPAITAAKEWAKKLRDKADLIVALTHQGYENDRRLAEAVPEIDIVIGGHSQAFLQNPPRIGSTLIVQSSFRNQFVGAIPVIRHADRATAGPDYRLVGLDPLYDPTTGAAPSAMEQLVGEFKAKITEVNSKRDSILMGEKDVKPQNEGIQTFPQCAQCHSAQYEFWLKTKHAAALEILVAKNQHKNKECLSCHTVGLDTRTTISELGETSKGKVSTESLSRLLAKLRAHKKIEKGETLLRAYSPVQCENCHAPGGDHPFSGAYKKTVSDSACLSCHTPERAPSWYTPVPNAKLIAEVIRKKRALVQCPPSTDSSP